MPRLPRTALIGAAGALAAFALFFGDGSTYPPLVWIGGLAVLAAAVGVALVLLGVLVSEAGWVRGPALLGWFVLWNGSIVWSLQPDRSWEYFNRGIVYFAFALLGVLVGAASTRSVRAVALGLLGLFGAVLVGSEQGDPEPRARRRADRAAARAARLLERARARRGDDASARFVGGAREHPWLLRVASVVVVGFAAVVVVLLYSRGGVVVALLAPAAYIALTRSGSRRPPCWPWRSCRLQCSALAFQQPGLVEDGQSYDERLRAGLWFAIGLLAAGAVVAGSRISQ